MAIKPTSSKSSCCGCFGRNTESPLDITPKHHEIHKMERVDSYRPTDINQMITTHIDEKALAEAEKAQEVYNQSKK